MNDVKTIAARIYLVYFKLKYYLIPSPLKTKIYKIGVLCKDCLLVWNLNVVISLKYFNLDQIC